MQRSRMPLWNALKAARLGSMPAASGCGLDEMNEGAVVEPQRKIAHAFGLCGLQFGKHLGDQRRILSASSGLVLYLIKVRFIVHAPAGFARCRDHRVLQQ